MYAPIITHQAACDDGDDAVSDHQAAAPHRLCDNSPALAVQPAHLVMVIQPQTTTAQPLACAVHGRMMTSGGTNNSVPREPEAYWSEAYWPMAWHGQKDIRGATEPAREPTLHPPLNAAVHAGG